jgi:hypothetical protein
MFIAELYALGHQNDPDLGVANHSHSALALAGLERRFRISAERFDSELRLSKSTRQEVRENWRSTH